MHSASKIPFQTRMKGIIQDYRIALTYNSSHQETQEFSSMNKQTTFQYTIFRMNIQIEKTNGHCILNERMFYFKRTDVLTDTNGCFYRLNFKGNI